MVSHAIQMYFKRDFQFINIHNMPSRKVLKTEDQTHTSSDTIQHVESQKNEKMPRGL